MENDARRKIRLTDVAFAVLVVGVFGSWVLSKSPVSLRYPDSMEYAQIARSLVEGKGYRIQTLWLSQLSLPTADPDTWIREGAPDVRRPPLFVWWEALCFKTFGVSDACAVWSSMVWMFLSGILVFLLAFRIAGKKAAWWAMILCLFDKEALLLGMGALTEPLFAVLLLSTALMLVCRDGWKKNLSIGLLLALSQLTRHNAFILAVPLVLAEGVNRRAFRLSRLVFLGAPLVLTLIILSVRNGAHTGIYSPVGITGWSFVNDTAGQPNTDGLHPDRTGLYPDHYAERSVVTPPSGVGLFMKHPGAFCRKWAGNLVKNLDSFFTAATPIVWLLLIAGIMVVVRASRGRELCIFVLGGAVITMLFFVLGEFEGRRFYVPFTPLLAVIAAVSFKWDKTRSIAVIPSWIAWVVLVVGSLGGLEYMNALSVDRGSRSLHELKSRFEESAPGDGVFLSDVPWAAGWYGEETAAWLPWSPTDVARIKNARVKAIFLSTYVLDLNEISPEWKQVFQGMREIPGFRRESIPGFPGFVLFTTDPRS